MKRLGWMLLLMSGCKTADGLPPAVSHWVVFEKSPKQILFDITVNGMPAKAALDTGAVGSGISRVFAERAGIGVAGHAMVTGAFGTKRLNVAKEFVVAFAGEKQGHVPVQQAVILEQDLVADVILGLQFFRNLIVQIDYPNSRFRFMTRSASTLAEQANTKTRIDIDSGHLLVEVELAGSREWLLFDTGSSLGVYLTRRSAQEGGWLTRAKPAGEITANSVTREADLEVLVLESLKLGPYELVDVPIAVQKHQDAKRLREAPKLGSRLVQRSAAELGILGNEILRHFVVTLDLDKGLLHLYGR